MSEGTFVKSCCASVIVVSSSSATLRSFQRTRNVARSVASRSPEDYSVLAFGKDARGADVLTPLSALGIGALYLGSVATPFSVNTAANETLAVVRSTGLWIGEDLSAGTLQQLDLVV